MKSRADFGNYSDPYSDFERRIERMAERAEFEFDMQRENKLLDEFNSAVPECTHSHDILDGGRSARKFKEFTKRLREAKA
jgi:hypothetical protein